eukprot:212734-Pyramimonas_sp.AAC.1
MSIPRHPSMRSPTHDPSAAARWAERHMNNMSSTLQGTMTLRPYLVAHAVSLRGARRGVETTR